MAGNKRRQELRGEMNLIISNLDQRWLDAASSQVTRHLGQLLDHKLDREVNHVLAWLPFFRGEADLTQFILDQLEHRRVYLPRITGNRGMEFIEVGKDWIRSLERGFFSIPGPRHESGAVYDPSSAASSLVLVPGLAFDRWGNWLGRVSGYYNKFFARREMQQTLKVGVCWEMQIVSDLPQDYYHVTLDWICHEGGLIRTAPRFDEDLSDE